MNYTPLFVVEQSFQLAGRGCVLAPGPSIEPGATPVRVGDKIQLLLPSGARMETHIGGLEMIKRIVRPAVLTAAVLLPPDISKDQVPVGTQVFLLAAE